MSATGSGSGAATFPSWNIPPRTPRSSVTVQVNDGGGSPIEGATVLICPYRLTGVTGPDGQVTIGYVPTGTIHIRAARADIGYIVDSNQNLTITGLSRTVALTSPYQAPACP